MNSKSLVEHAYSKFSEQDYRTALHLFRKAGREYGRELFEYNISLCLSELNNNSLKSESILNSYFDKTYVVNLKHETEKRLKVLTHLQNHHINYVLFTATNGYEGQPLQVFTDYINKPLGSLQRYKDFNQKEIKRKKKFIESPGAIGYIFTYLEIIKDAKRNGYKRILILVDDIVLSNNFENKVREFINSIKPDWKVLQLGASQYNWSSVNKEDAKQEGFYFPRRLDTTGSFAIALDMSIANELIEAEESFEAPFDHLPLGEIYERYLGKCFVAYPNIVMPDVSDSSIRESRCQISHASRMKWEFESFPYPLGKPSIAVVVSSKINLKYFESFSQARSLPFELRIYKTSSDGLRPVHHTEQIEEGYVLERQVIEEAIVPKADYCCLIENESVLDETSIINYIQYKLGVLHENETPLVEVLLNFKEAVLGRVSVIVPTYKRPTNLRTAVTSILEQDYKDIEVVVVSDNGLDSKYNKETDLVVNNLRSNFPSSRIEYIQHTKNRNGASARNTGIFHATGSYISFLDDDDIYLSGRLSSCIEVLERNSKIYGGVYCGFLGWNSPKNDFNRYKEGDLTKELLLLDYLKHYLHTNTATYRASAVNTINGFDESYRRHQDLEFNLRYFEHYEILASKVPGVRLNPAPSDISNKVYGIAMLELKNKFLTQFSSKINSFEEKELIYKRHWGEVARYIDNKTEFSNYLSGIFENGQLQLSLMLDL